MAKQKNEKKSVREEKKKNPTAERGWKFYSAVILLFSFALYFNSIFNDYNLDDELVTQNQKVTSKGWEVLKPNFDVFSKQEFQDSSFSSKLKYSLPVVYRVPYYEDRSGYKYEYRPIVLFSFAAEHMLFAQKDFVNGAEVYKDNPAISHFFNVLLYSLLCLLLFYVLKKLLKQYDIIFPFIITILFAAHPIHTEVVASIKNRDEIMALIFGLLSLWFSIRFIEKKKLYHLIFVVLFFLLGILSKPTTITFAALIPLSLAMLTTSTYWNAMLITVLLAVPAILFSRLYSLNQQIALGIMLLLATSGFYLLKNLDAFFAGVRNFLSEFKKPSNPIAEKNIENNADLDLKLFKKPINIFAIAFIILPAFMLSAAGIYIGNVWLGVVPLLALAITYFVAQEELKLALITPLSVIALFIAVKFHIGSRPVESVLIIFLANQILSRNKAFRIIGIANYILYALVAVVALHSVYFLAILIFAGVFYKKLFPAAAILAAFAVAIFLKKTFGVISGAHAFNFGYLNWVVIVLGFVLLWKQKEKVLNRVSVALIPLVLVGYFFTTVYKTNGSLSENLKAGYYRIKNVKAADPTPVQSIRPLRYVEFPIEQNDPLTIKLGTGMLVLGKYLKLILIPYPMSYYYGYACITPVPLSNAGAILALIIYLSLFGTAIFFFRKNALLSFSLLFYLASISVFSDLVFPIPGIMGDRFLLIPSIGFCILLALILAAIFKQNFTGAKISWANIKQPLKISLVVILVFYSGISFARNFNWKDRLTLFRHDISVVENSAQAQNLLGFHLFNTSMHETDKIVQKQLREEAIPHFKKALEIYPPFLNASFDLGRTYESLQRFDEAFEQYHTTITIDSTFTTPYFGMGTIQDYRGNYQEAIPLYEKFLVRTPGNMEAYTNISFDYFRLGQYDKSIEVNKTALKIRPGYLNTLINLGKTYAKINQKDSALYYFEQALAVQPNDPNLIGVVQQLRKK